MFLVFNKSKIYSYLVAVSMVVILFVAASKLDDVVTPKNNILETSTNTINKNNFQNNITELNYINE